MPFLSLNGPAGSSAPPVQIRYREHGASATSAPPVLLVHGAGGSSAIWLSTLPRLARSGGPGTPEVRRVVALDLPGHGRSGGATVTVDDWVTAVGGAAATLCLGRSVLVGHSLGGLVALAAALTWPDRVAGLILVTTAAALEVSPKLLQGLEHEFARWPERFERWAYAPDTPADVRRRSALLAAGAGQAQTVADFRAAASLSLDARLGEIACPTLVVVGEKDQMVPPRHGEALAAGIPGAGLVRLRSGHVPMHEDADAFARALGTFLAHIR